MPVLLLFFLLFAPAYARAESNIFAVQGVEVTLPLTGAGGASALQTALELAQKKGLRLLLNRMIPQKEWESRQAQIAELEKDAPRLTANSVLRNEQRDGDTLAITADLVFQSEAVRKTLLDLGIPFSETPFPPTLLVAGGGDNDSRQLAPNLPLPRHFLAVAKEFGLPIVAPIGDLDDMVNLDWNEAQSGSRNLLQWIEGQYGASRLWLLTVRLTQSDGPQGKTFRAEGALREPPAGEPVKAEASGSFANEEAAMAGLYPDLARGLVNRAMESFVSSHLLVAGQAHATFFQVVHDARLPELGRFLARLQAAPGMVSALPISLAARETRIEAVHNLRDEDLTRHLADPSWEILAHGPDWTVQMR